ncbi:MAG: FMN-dependent NADH-azoreductase [Rhodanobacter sp.]
MKLLHLDSSALGGYSVSRQLTAEIVTQLKRQTPTLEVDYHDLAAHPLSHWAPVADANDPAAQLGNQMMEAFQAADIVVIGAPMYNFSIPSQLKAWIDRIVVAGKTFRYTANGPEGLAAGKQVIIASSRGSAYRNTPIAAMDFQENYLRSVFGFIGVTDVSFVRAEGLASGDAQKAAAITSARESISQLATTLANAA